MRCHGCGHNLHARETGACPVCGRWFSTGAEIIPMVKRLRCPSGPRRCVVCGLKRANGGARCPRCSSAFARAVAGSPTAPFEGAAA